MSAPRLAPSRFGGRRGTLPAVCYPPRLSLSPPRGGADVPEEAEGRRPRRDRHGRPALPRVAREPPLVRGHAPRRERELGRAEVRGRDEGPLGAQVRDPRGGG